MCHVCKTAGGDDPADTTAMVNARDDEAPNQREGNGDGNGSGGGGSGGGEIGENASERDNVPLFPSHSRQNSALGGGGHSRQNSAMGGGMIALELSSSGDGVGEDLVGLYKLNTVDP
jgi:hypothetical protein